MARLTKRQVERLVADVDRAGDDAEALRAALRRAGAPAALLRGGLDDLFDLVATLNETRRVPVDPELAARARAWLADDPDPETVAELTALLDAGDGDAVADRFAARLGFGTAGIRGELGAGPHRMNLATVRATAAGVASWVAGGATGGDGDGVVIGRDGRHRSRDFARDVARVLAGAGTPALALPGEVPTPIVAFAVRHLGTAAGVMVTASHNPPRDNGIKVYGGDGRQIVSPADTEIAAAIESVGPVTSIPLSDDVRHLGPEVLDAYVEQAARVVGDGPRDLLAVHTAMHGVGWDTVRRVFATAGFKEPAPVPEQAQPDGDFPTVAFPNPEEPGALDLSLALAQQIGADVVLANDPDADRLGVAVPSAGGGWRALTGDEIGVLLADHVLASSTGDDRLVACSLVSCSMLGRIAAAHGVHFRTTLTGFKWITRAGDDVPGSRLVFGYEEALGYAVGDLVRDKDGITAALTFADLVARLKAEGRTVDDQLEALARAHGLHATRQWSLRRPVEEIRAAVARVVESPPTAVAGRAVVEVDRPADDILVLHLEGDSRVVIRPSGTEPKLKTYLQVVAEDIGGWEAAQAAAAADLEDLRRGVAEVLALGD